MGDEVRARKTSTARALQVVLRRWQSEVTAAEDGLGKVVTLARSEGMSWDDIGAGLGISGTTAQRRWMEWTKR